MGGDIVFTTRSATVWSRNFLYVPDNDPREAPGENIPSRINAPVSKQRFPEEATSILTQGEMPWLNDSVFS